MNSSPATVADVSLRAPAGVFERLARLRAAQGHLSTVLMSAVQVFGIRLAGAGITYASMVLLARWLGAHDFGVYAYVSVVVTLLGIALSFGFGSSALRFVASYAARAKTARLSGFLKASFTIVAALSALGAIAGAALVVVFRGAIQPYYVAPLLVGLACVPVWTLLNQFEATGRAFGWVHVAYVPGYIVRPSALVILLGGFILLGGTADATAAIWAMVGACLLAAIVQGVLVLSRMRAISSATARGSPTGAPYTCSAASRSTSAPSSRSPATARSFVSACRSHSRASSAW